VLVQSLQQQHHVVKLEALSDIVYLSLLLICGLSAIIVATIYPLVDCVITGKPQRIEHGWADIVRCLTIFLGINWASSVRTSSIPAMPCLPPRGDSSQGRITAIDEHFLHFFFFSFFFSSSPNYLEIAAA